MVPAPQHWGKQSLMCKVIFSWLFAKKITFFGWNFWFNNHSTRRVLLSVTDLDPDLSNQIRIRTKKTGPAFTRAELIKRRKKWKLANILRTTNIFPDSDFLKSQICNPSKYLGSDSQHYCSVPTIQNINTVFHTEEEKSDRRDSKSRRCWLADEIISFLAVL